MSNPSPTPSTFHGPAYECAREIVEKLRQHGFTAYFAGGCVRDHLWGIEASDFDVATDARPNQVADLFGANRAWLVGAAFGVVCIPVRRHNYRGQVEVATFRSDGAYSDGRHPDSVRFATPEEDAQRRDFSINGLFFDPLEDRVLDYVGGVQDLNARVLRAIGSPRDRFEEDKLRLLRAIRFAARFALRLDPQTEAGIRDSAPNLNVVSVERIAIEVRKTLLYPLRTWAVEQWLELGLLQAMAPSLAQAWVAHPRAVSSSLQLLQHLPSQDFAWNWSLLLLPIYLRAQHPTWFDEPVSTWSQGSEWSSAKSLAEHWKRSWKLANDEVAGLEFYHRFGETVLVESTPRWSAIQPWLLQPRIASSFSLLHEILQTESFRAESLPCSRREVWHTNLTTWKACLDWPRERLDPTPWIDGGDLHRLGIRPGPAFAEHLRTVRNMQLDGELTTREEALAWLANRATPPEPNPL